LIEQKEFELPTRIYRSFRPNICLQKEETESVEWIKEPQRFWMVCPRDLLPSRSIIMEIRKAIDRATMKAKRTASW
jgi:hypothetical protein